MSLDRFTPLKRSPIKRSTKQLARTAMPRKQRNDKSDFPLSVRQAVMLRVLCEFPACGAKIQHVHHIKLRSQGGKGTLDNAAGLCRFHHAWVHDHPAEAHQMGLMKLTKGSSTSS